MNRSHARVAKKTMQKQIGKSGMQKETETSDVSHTTQNANT